MSYILEALRKADAERERGTVPDLHAQPQPGAPIPDEVDAQRGARWLGPLLGGGLVLAGALAWHWMQREAAVNPAAAPAATPKLEAAAVSVAAAPVAVTAVPATPPEPMPAASASVAAPAAASPTQPASAEPAAAAKAQPLQRTLPSPPMQGRSEARRTQTPAPREAAAPLPAAAKPAKTTEPADVGKGTGKAEALAPAAPLPVLSGLPEDLRRQVPPLAVGGSMYSSQPERRMVILNGQVFQEGAALAPELVLEQIRPKSAVLSIRGQRFELPL
jgi:general secretion pathway protein B